MTVVLPLPCYPYPVPPVVVQAIKEAKEALCARDGLDFKVQICEAFPGEPTRVLSFKGPTPFAADVAKLRDWQDKAELQRWVEWCLDEEQPLENGFTFADWVAYTIPGAREVTTIYDQMIWEEDERVRKEKEEAESDGRVRFR